MKRPDVLKREDGFTLIEIIAVLILLGILAAVAIPKYIDLQTEARNRAAESAIAETQARLSMGYGQYLLNHGTAPTTIADICTEVGTAILPAGASGTVPDMGDFTVTIDGTTTTTTAAISVTVVQTVTLGAAVTGTWTLP